MTGVSYTYDVIHKHDVTVLSNSSASRVVNYDGSVIPADQLYSPWGETFFTNGSQTVHLPVGLLLRTIPGGT